MTKMFSSSETRSWLDSLDKRASSASVMCETDDGKLLIVKAGYKEHWTVPGGVVDAGEMPRDAAIRETREEVGLQIDPNDLQFQYIATRTSDIALTYQFVFKARLTAEMLTHIELDHQEILEFDLITREEAITDRRFYGKVIKNWACGFVGYVEQEMVKGD